MNKLFLGLIFFLITGCSSIQSGVDTVKKYWPRDHDPVMFERALSLSIDIDAIDCDKPEFNDLIFKSMFLARYAELRRDPQTENLKGLHQHFEKLKSNPKKIFCELGKKTALQRLDVAINAWRKR